MNFKASNPIQLLVLGLFAASALFVFSSCEEEIPDGVWIIDTDQDYKVTAQEAFIQAETGDTIHFKAGTYMFDNQLSIDGKTGIVIRGEGRENTILDFSGQLAGAQGILADGMDMLVFADFTVQDPAGDGIKLKDSDGVSFVRVGVEYTGTVSADNGAYGLYPVTSHNILVQDCYVRGASDAGIYVGQTEQVHVTGCYVTECVAGIEIENCINSDVWNNTVENNTGGILVFDLPTLPVIKNGNTCRVFDNMILDNRHINFAPPGNTVGTVPPGTGVMILAFDGVEVFGNTIHGNNVLGVGVVSYNTLISLDEGSAHTDTEFNPYVYNVSIHDNDFQRGAYPADPNFIGFILAGIYDAGGHEPDVVYDGDLDAASSDPVVCVSGQSDYQFLNVDAINEFTDIVEGDADYQCNLAPLPVTVIDAPVYN